MSTYGYFKHDELSDYAIAHHGIKGQKWGIRRFQNPDGSLTAEGRARYGISDKEYSTAKKLYRGKGKYSIPLYTNLKSGSYEKAQKSVEAILKYDAMRSEAENGKNPGYFNAGRVGLNPIINTIHHFKDKNGKIALSYAEVPRIGEVYVKGSGNFNDLDLNKLFKKIPKGLEKPERKDMGEKTAVKESPYKVKGATQSIKNFSVSKAASDCGKMIDKFNKELGNSSDSKIYSGEDIQMFLEKNLKEFNNLWDDGSNTIFDLEEKIAKELDKKGYKYID